MGLLKERYMKKEEQKAGKFRIRLTETVHGAG
jgi:hypothetical protein